jgi:hypothetical protein
MREDEAGANFMMGLAQAIGHHPKWVIVPAWQASPQERTGGGHRMGMGQSQSLTDVEKEASFRLGGRCRGTW